MKHILIVEDELLIASLLEKHIVKAGYHCVGIATDYIQAVTFLRTKKIDLVLLDINLSGSKSGIVVANYINNNYSIPFIFLTSFSDNKTMLEVKNTRPLGYLSKPFKEIDVITAINLYFETKSELSKIRIQIGKQTIFFDPKKVVYAESNHVYTNLYLDHKTYKLRISLSKLIGILPQNNIIRINRSIAINPKRITHHNSHFIQIQERTFKFSHQYSDYLKQYLSNNEKL